MLFFWIEYDIESISLFLNFGLFVFFIKFINTCYKLLYLLESNIFILILTTPELQKNLHGIPLLCPFLCLVSSNIKIMISDLVSQFHGFHLRFLRLALVVRLLLLLLEEIFPIIHDFRNRNSILHSSHFDEVELPFFSKPESLSSRELSDFFPTFIDNNQFTSRDLFVYGFCILIFLRISSWSFHEWNYRAKAATAFANADFFLAAAFLWRTFFFSRESIRE